MKKTLPFLGLLALTAAVPAAAQEANASIEQAYTTARSQLENAISNYSGALEDIREDREPLVNARDALEQEVIQLRAEAQQVRQQRDQRQFSLSQLQNRVEELGQTESYLGSVLNDYVSRFNSLLLEGERQQYEETIEAARDAAENPDLTITEKFEAQLAVLDSSVAHIKNALGAYTAEGYANTPDGVQVEGTFLFMGPTAFFRTADGSMASLISGTGNRIEQKIMEIGFGDEIAATIESGEGMLPLDPSGSALLIYSAEGTFGDEVAAGGKVVLIIFAFGVAAILIFLFKLFEIMGVKEVKQKDLDAVLGHLDAGEKDKALAHAKGVSGPAGEMLVAAVENYGEDRELLEEILYEKVIKTQPKMERFLPLIAVIAATAPLLGLLGTVTGMINTFKLITVFGTGDARSLSTGISEALITTKWGLIVAIFSLIFHALLNRMAKGVVASMEQSAVTFINASAEQKERRKSA